MRVNWIRSYAHAAVLPEEKTAGGLADAESRARIGMESALSCPLDGQCLSLHGPSAVCVVRMSVSTVDRQVDSGQRTTIHQLLGY